MSVANHRPSSHRMRRSRSSSQSGYSTSAQSSLVSDATCAYTAAKQRGMNVGPSGLQPHSRALRLVRAEGVLGQPFAHSGVLHIGQKFGKVGLVSCPSRYAPSVHAQFKRCPLPHFPETHPLQVHSPNNLNPPTHGSPACLPIQTLMLR